MPWPDRCGGSCRAATGGELGNLPGELDAGGSGAHDDERQPDAPERSIGLPLGHLERAEDSPAQLQRVVDGLHARAHDARTPGGRNRTGSHRWRGSGCRRKPRCVAPDVSTVRRRRWRSMLCTSPRSTVAFRWWRRMSRIGGAMSPSARIPVAIWYSSGWKRWWLLRSMTVDINVSVSQSPGGEQTAEAAAHDHDAMPVHVTGPPVACDCTTRVRPNLLDDGIGDTLVGVARARRLD